MCNSVFPVAGCSRTALNSDIGDSQISDPLDEAVHPLKSSAFGKSETCSECLNEGSPTSMLRPDLLAASSFCHFAGFDYIALSGRPQLLDAKREGPSTR